MAPLAAPIGPLELIILLLLALPIVVVVIVVVLLVKASRRRRGSRTMTPPPRAPLPMSDELARLNELRSQGVLSDEEFAQAKRRLIS